MKAILATLLLAFAAIAPMQAQTTATGVYPTIPAATPTAAAPVWAKLVLNNNVVTCFYATGTTAPTTWTQIGIAQTVNFANNALLIGLYITSHNTAAISTGTIDNVTMTPPSSYKLADTDIGSPAFMGSANLINNVWALSGSGADIWNTSDQFNFQPWLVWGNCTIVCRITSLGAGDPWQKIGIMIRDSYNSGSAYASFVATSGKGLTFQCRTSSNANADKTMLVAPATSGVISQAAIGYDLNSPSSYVLRP